MWSIGGPSATGPIGEAFRGDSSVCYWSENRVMKVSRSQRWWSRVAGLCGMVVVLTMLPGEPPKAAGGAVLGGLPSARHQFRPLEHGGLLSRRSQVLSRRMIRMPAVALPLASVDVAAPLISARPAAIQVVQAEDDGALDSQFRPIRRRHLTEREAATTAPAPSTVAPYAQWPITGYQGWGSLPYAVAPPAVPLAPPTPYLGSPYGYGAMPAPNPYLGLPYGYSTLPPPVAVPPYPQMPVPVAPYPQLPYPASPLLAPPLWPY